MAFETAKGDKTIERLASEFGIHSNPIGRWKKKLLEDLPSVFEGGCNSTDKYREEIESELYPQIG